MSSAASTADSYHPLVGPVVWIGGGVFGGLVMDAAQWPWGAILGGLAGIVAAWIGADGRRKAETIDDPRRRLDRLRRAPGRDGDEDEDEDEVDRDDTRYEDDKCESKASGTR